MNDHPLFQLIKQFHGKVASTIFTPLMGKPDGKQIAFLRSLEKELATEKNLTIPLTQLNVVIFDIETTGFFPERGDQILSIGALKFRNGHISDETFYSLVHFNGSLSPEIKHLTNLDDADLQMAPTLSDVLIRFYEFVQSDLLIAHHASHEKKFLHHANWRVFKKPFQHRIVDTSFVFNLIVPEKHIVTLDDYCTHSGVEIRNRHHALGDAMLLAELWQQAIPKLSEQGCDTLTDVYERAAMQWNHRE